MRHLLSFTCEGALLGATLDPAEGRTGLIIVTGGTQTRIGSHRMFERLAGQVAAAGHPCFRFDRRGVGDSEGEDPGYRGSMADLAAAVSAFRSECPHLDRVVGFGLCDGATALALFGAEAGVDSVLLANPWFVESEAGAPPAAAIKRHYRDQLMSLEGWKRLLGGSISYKKLLKGLMKVAAPPPANLAGEVAASLRGHGLPAHLLLARRDATAVAAEELWQSPLFREVRGNSPSPDFVESDSHTFARPGDAEALLSFVLKGLRP
jgi:exosortase A-associated hydrolase 1